MTYCGAIGSVNVLSFMSTDLFDESQENPFLLTAARSEPATSLTNASMSSSPPTPQCSPGQLQRSSFKKPQVSIELPLDDLLATPKATIKIQEFREVEPSTLHKYVPGRTVEATASPVTSPLRSILKRQSSYESNASTTATAMDYHDDISSNQPHSPLPYQYQPQHSAEDPCLPTDSDLHKLLYSLTRFGLASNAPPQGNAQFQTAFASSSSLPASPTRSVSFASSQKWNLKDQMAGERKKRRSRSRRSDHGGETSDSDDGSAHRGRSRGSVTYATVKSLLRGGNSGRGNSPSRVVKRGIPEYRRKSMGTISSRLKVRQKFARPTILTDAYHRVSDMKLGTKPMSTAIKHLAFPYMWEDNLEDREEADPGMPSPKGQLRRMSLVTLETLDKIGTRAACPVHLIEEAAPDYSQVRPRVDSYNAIKSPKRGLRRPSAWLSPSAVANASEFVSDGEDEDAGYGQDEFALGQQPECYEVGDGY